MLINTNGAANAFVNIERRYKTGDEKYHFLFIIYNDKT
jgi:hypothetical protein